MWLVSLVWNINKEYLIIFLPHSPYFVLKPNMPALFKCLNPITKGKCYTTRVLRAKWFPVWNITYEIIWKNSNQTLSLGKNTICMSCMTLSNEHKLWFWCFYFCCFWENWRIKNQLWSLFSDIFSSKYSMVTSRSQPGGCPGGAGEGTGLPVAQKLRR